MDTSDRIEAEAARWFARHDAGPLSEAERRSFEAWQAGDSRRLGAYIRLEAVNARLARVSALSGLRPARPPRRWVPAAVAAALALVVLPAVLLNQPQPPARKLSTSLGEQYRTSLPDGSLVELNTSTQVIVALKAKERDIRLKQGEAVFEVAHDRSRPFIVHTQYGDVRAVGTVFSVNATDGLMVGVSEGVVSVEKDGHVLGHISAGETFRLKPSGDTSRQGGQAEEIRRSLAWRDGKIAFAGKTLADAALEFNRYNRVHIEVTDPAAAALRVGGNFRATDPEGFAVAVEQSLPVTASQADGVIILRSRAAR